MKLLIASYRDLDGRCQGMSFQEARVWKLWFIKYQIKFGPLALLRLWRIDQDQWLFYWIVLLKCRAVDWVLDGRLHVFRLRGFRVWRPRSIVSISNILGIFGLSGFENTKSFCRDKLPWKEKTCQSRHSEFGGGVKHEVLNKVKLNFGR